MMRKKKIKAESEINFVASSFTHIDLFKERSESYEKSQVRHQIERETLSRCEEIVKSAKSSWCVKTPEQMANLCIELIRGERLKLGVTPRFSQEQINDLKAKKKLR